MTIGEVARASGLRPSAIRYYEQAGILPSPKRAGGQRRYDRRVLEQLAVVRFAKTCGFALPEVRSLLNAFADDAPLANRLKGVAQRKLTDLDAESAAIEHRKDQIRRALSCRCVDLGECGRRILARRAETG